jgi:hypothetical protein
MSLDERELLALLPEDLSWKMDTGIGSCGKYMHLLISKRSNPVFLAVKLLTWALHRNYVPPLKYS